MLTPDWIRLFVELLGFFLAGMGVVWAVRISIAVLNTKVDMMAEELKKVTDILVRLGAFDEKFRALDQRMLSQDGRLERLETRVNELAHGESFVLPIKSPFEK